MFLSKDAEIKTHCILSFTSHIIFKKFSFIIIFIETAITVIIPLGTYANYSELFIVDFRFVLWKRNSQEMLSKNFDSNTGVNF